MRIPRITARLILERLAQTHDGQSAYVLAMTFDPEVLTRLKVIGIKPDSGRARHWYEQARAWGSHEAGDRLASLAGQSGVRP